MIEAATMTPALEKKLLQQWFETVAFDEESEGIPELDPEVDDESPESRANSNHDRLGRFAHGSGTGTANADSVGVSDSKANDLAERVQAPDGGFTIDPRTEKDVDSGFAVAIYPDRSREIPHTDVTGTTIKDYAKSNEDLLTESGNMMGGWHDPDSGSVWLDVSRVTSDKTEAISLAKEHNQIAIFDLGSGSSINTGGTGRNLDLGALEYETLMAELRKRDPDNPF